MTPADVSTLVEDITNREYLDGATAFPDYDWIDTPACEVTDYEFVVSKRRCPDASSTSLLSSRFTGRFPNIAKKLRSKRENRSSSVTGSIQETIASRSRASSLRSPSIFDKTEVIQPPVNNQEPIDLEFDSVMNVEEEEDELFVEVDRTASRTPLLPPVLTLKREEQIQSPLQSPSVDATPSLPQSPFDSPNTFKHLPSPPLSTKPSVASFHHRTMLPPSAEIPIINLSDAQDEWSIRLGHGNFTISPEPYQLQAPVTLVSCQRLKADWELARNNFALHIKRTGQVYSETSKTYYLTQAKWSQINLRWKSCYEQALGDIPSISQEMLQASFHSQDSNTPSSLDAIPSSPIISSKEGKFPKPAASGIVGPMEQIKPMISPRSCRKRSFWKFLQGVWPSGAFGVSQA